MFDSLVFLLCCILSRGMPWLASHTITPLSDGEFPQIPPPGSFYFYEMHGLFIFFGVVALVLPPLQIRSLFLGLQCFYFNEPLVVQAPLSPSRYVISRSNPYIFFIDHPSIFYPQHFFAKKPCSGLSEGAKVLLWAVTCEFAHYNQIYVNIQSFISRPSSLCQRLAEDVKKRKAA